MAKNEKQKLKLLFLARILWRETDEAHPLTMTEILAALAEEGVTAERKSVYDDIDALRDFGLDIERTRARTPGYYIASRTLELPELKLLVDAVQSSNFITHKKSTELIRKLEEQTSVHEARTLSRTVYVANRVKTMNESIYYTVDELHRAMQENRAITFRYFDWNMKKERVLRHGGKLYHVSPWILLWEDDNYYLLAYDAELCATRYYRVDKILDVTLTEEPRRGVEEFSDFDTAQFSKKVFGMFGGDEELVTLRCAESMAGVILDRFGSDLRLQPGEGSFTASVRVIVSRPFLGWVASLSPEVEIESPAAVRKRMREFLDKARMGYET